jgi:hypothetical protein
VDAKRDLSSTQPIECIQVFAQRGSGSNYLQALIKKNFSIPETYRYGHKHFPIWAHAPLDSQRGSYAQNEDFYTLDHNENCLFIVIVREPYDWIRSLYSAPHHSRGSLRRMSFRRFIRSPWRLDERDPSVIEEKMKNPLTDKDPFTGLDFQSALYLRTAKLRTFLALKDKVHHIYYINYEVLQKHPKQVLQEISELFDIPTKQTFIDIKEYKGQLEYGKYTKRKYAPLFMIDLAQINKGLNPELEAKMGYKLKRFYVN